MIFLAVLPALEVYVNSTLLKFHGCKMTEKGLKHRSNRKDSIHAEQSAMGLSPLSRVTRRRFSIKYYGFSIPWHLAINVPRIALNHEKFHFLHCSVRGVLYDLINVLGPVSVILQP